MVKYSDNINPCALRLVTDYINAFRSREKISVLEFGCSTGALGSILLKTNKNLTWTGIDYDPEAIRIAQSRIDTAYTLNLNTVSQDDMSSLGIKPQLLVMVDVLEHLYEPSSFLGILAATFPGASVVCILPNIACYQTYDKLTSHDFSYEDYGIFDKTHKTFYTPHSAISLFGQFGYVPSLDPIFLPDPVVSHYLNQDISFPYIFSRNRYNIHVLSHYELVSLCSYGFGILFKSHT